MKESKLLEMKNKVEALTRVVQHLLNEITQVKDLAIGTLETIKKMPDYEEAIDALKKDVVEKPSKTEKVKSDRKTSPHLLPDERGMVTYIIAGIISIPQVFVAKQWNLVFVNLNVAIAYIILYFS